MTIIDGRIDWPAFARRSDFLPGLASQMQMHVSAKFNTGFDARNDEYLLFFCSDLLAMHPLSILVPASVIDLVYEHGEIRLADGRLHFAAVDGKPHELVEIEPVNAEPGLQIKDAGLLEENLRVLLSNLKLFGRSSIVLDLVLGCNTEKNILTGAETTIFSPTPDLELLSRFIGAGEGLTPAFDDFLSGMLLVDRSASINRISVPDGFFANARLHTTVQSLQQLQFAASGKLSLRYERFLADLLSRHVKSAEIVRIINYGHSSGTDILCGIWHYLNQSLSQL